MHSLPSATLRPACRECRARKVRCDRASVRCGPCTRLQLGCSYAPVPQSQAETGTARPGPVTQAGLARRRVRRACDACRVVKARCSGRQPCSRCHSRHLDCIFPAGTDRHDSLAGSATRMLSGQLSPRSSPRHPTHHTVPPSIGQCTRPGQAADIVAFFNSLSTSPVSIQFLHRATVLADYSQGRLDPVLATTLCVLGRLNGSLEQDRDGQHEQQYEQDEAWLTHVGRLVVEPRPPADTPPLIRLQVLILVLQHHIIWSQVMEAWTLVAVGARLALTLRLNYELPSLEGDPIAQETRRRMVWAIWLVDMLLAGGIEDLVVLPVDRIHVRLPCDEYTFERGVASRAGWLLDRITENPSEPRQDALGFYLQHMECRHRILNYNKRVVRHSSPLTTPTESSLGVDDELSTLQTQLTLLQSTLPQDLQLTPARLRLKAHSHDLAIYLALHIASIQSECNLHRIFVPGMREAAQEAIISAAPPQLVATSQTACLVAAARVANLLAELYRAGVRKVLAIPNLVVGIHQISQIVYQVRHLLLNSPARPTSRSRPVGIDMRTLQADLQDAANMVRVLQPPRLRGPKAAEMLNEADSFICALSRDGHDQQQHVESSSWPSQSRSRHLASKGSFLDEVEVQTVAGDNHENNTDNNDTNDNDNIDDNDVMLRAGESLISLQQQQQQHRNYQNRQHNNNSNNSTSKFGSDNSMPLWGHDLQDPLGSVIGQGSVPPTSGGTGGNNLLPWDPLDVQLYDFFDPS